MIFKIYSSTRNSLTLKSNYPSGLIFFQIFLKGQLDKYLNYTIRKESFLSKALYTFKIGTYLSSIKCPGFVWEATPVLSSWAYECNIYTCMISKVLYTATKYMLSTTKHQTFIDKIQFPGTYGLDKEMTAFAITRAVSGNCELY